MTPDVPHAADAEAVEHGEPPADGLAGSAAGLAGAAASVAHHDAGTHMDAHTSISDDDHGHAEPALGPIAATFPMQIQPGIGYEVFSWLFFQHLAWLIGDDGLVHLVETLPAGADKAQHETALAAYPEMPTLFHLFVRDLTDAAIEDTGGGPVPRAGAI